VPQRRADKETKRISEEPAIVVPPDAIPNERAVVIKQRHAATACPAVLRAKRANDATRVAQLGASFLVIAGSGSFQIVEISVIGLTEHSSVAFFVESARVAAPSSEEACPEDQMGDEAAGVDPVVLRHSVVV